MRQLERTIRTLMPSALVGAAIVVYSLPASGQHLMETFDNGTTNTPITLEFFNSPPEALFGPQPSGGNPGGMLQITTNGVNDNRNYVYFDRTAQGSYARINFSFDLLMGPADASADGGSISFIDTNVFGAIGAPPAGVSLFGVPEDPAQVGVLGIGFDTWSNTGIGDGEAVGGGSNSAYNDVSLYWNSSRIDQFYDPNQPDVLPNGIRIDDNDWHTVEGTIQFAGSFASCTSSGSTGLVSMTIDDLAVWNDLPVPGLAPFESRVMFGARTGGENENFFVDNLSVEYFNPTATHHHSPVPLTPVPTKGYWSIREWRPFPNQVNGTAGADAIINDPVLQTCSFISDGMSSIINFADPENPGNGYSIPLPKQPFLSDSTGDDNDIVMRAIAKIIIPEDGQYTFGIDGDDGTRLTISGADFTFQAGGGTARSEVLEFPNNTGNAFTLGSTFLAAGEYDAELVWQERGGGAFVEVFAAPGVKNALDADFSPVGLRESIVAAQGTLPTTTGDWDVRFVDVDSAVMQLNNLTDAAAAIALGDFDLGVELARNSTSEVVNFHDPDSGGLGGRIGGDTPIDGELSGIDDNDYAVMATNIVSIPEDGDYLFGFGSDDGASLTLDGANFTILNPSGVRAVTNNGQTIEFNANTGNSDTLATTFLTAGEYPIEFLMWERGGGSWGEVLAGVGSEAVSSLSLRLLGSPEEAFDIVIPAGLQLGGEGPPPPDLEGDYNSNGAVEQADLDLVLLSWGAAFDALPAEWVQQRPTEGVVSQAQLDGVLLNWGDTLAAGQSLATVPEPGAAFLCAIMLAVAALRCRRENVSEGIQ